MGLICCELINLLNSTMRINSFSKSLLLITALIVCALSFCPPGQKDNGDGVCILSTVPCAMDHHDNGMGTECIPVNGTCADGYIDDSAGDKCILNCTAEEKNNGEGVCVGLVQPCAPGYESSDAADVNANCQNCSLDYKFDGFQFCVPLDANCARGFKDNGEGLCVLFTSACAPGYKSNNQSNTNCFACDTAHGYRDDGEACSLVTDPCSFGFKDNGNGSCVFIYLDCARGYMDDGTGNCILQSSGACGPNFIDNGNGECLLVIEIFIKNFFFRDAHNKPARCDPTCSRCGAGGNCTQCNVGYALKTSTKSCVYCGGCQSCNASNPSQCTACFAPQVINITSNKCVDVTCSVTNCLSCNLDSTCKVCLPGSRLNNNVCQLCADQNCFSCSANTSVCDSTGCNNGFVFSTRANKCLPCATGCLSCKTTDVSDCEGVTPGYYVIAESGKSRAKRCFTNCDQCSNSTTCIQCITNFIASTDGSQCLLKCSDSCYTCASNNPDNCTSCYSGTNLNSATGVCEPDLSCNSTASCVAYVNGYVVQSGYYYRCTYSDSSCVSCSFSDLSTCTKCLSGYYFKNSTCRQCSDNCISCLGDRSCFACGDGYYLRKGKGASTGQCKPCDSSCLTCSDNPYVCTSCPTNYTWDGSSCVSIHKVTVIVKLSVAIQNFINYYESLILWFVQQVLVMRPGRSFSRRQIIFKTVVSGSVTVGAQLSMDDPSGVNSVASQLTETMNSGSATVDGLVISGSAVGSEPQTTNTTTSQTPNTLGIILGVVIPLGILILIAIIVVIVKVYNRREPEYEAKMDDSQRNYSGKHFKSEDKHSEKV